MFFFNYSGLLRLLLIVDVVNTFADVLLIKSLSVKSSRGTLFCRHYLAFNAGSSPPLWLPVSLRLANPVAHFEARHSLAQGLRERDNIATFSCTRSIKRIFRSEINSIPTAGLRTTPAFMVINSHIRPRGCYCQPQMLWDHKHTKN